MTTLLRFNFVTQYSESIVIQGYLIVKTKIILLRVFFNLLGLDFISSTINDMKEVINLTSKGNLL